MTDAHPELRVFLLEQLAEDVIAHWEGNHCVVVTKNAFIEKHVMKLGVE